MRKYSATNKLQRRSVSRTRDYKSRPFWLPASNFYILAAAAAIAFFFFLWWILHEGGEEIPYVPAGIGASIVLGGPIEVQRIDGCAVAQQVDALIGRVLDRHFDARDVREVVSSGQQPGCTISSSQSSDSYGVAPMR